MSVTRIRLEVVAGPDYRSHDSDGRAWEHSAWRIRLTNEANGQSFESPYRMGSALTREDLTAAMVLEGMLSDASAVENARYASALRGSEEWEEFASEFVRLEELSYVEAKSYRETYEACRVQTDNLRRIIGDAAEFEAAAFPSGEDDYETIAAKLAGEAV